MKYLLTKEESEKLYPGLKDMPKGEIPEDATQDLGFALGADHLNWKDGISLDKKEYAKEYRETPENKVKAKEYQREYQRGYNKRQKRKEYLKEYYQRPEVIAKRREHNKANYIKKKLAISTT